MNRQPSLKPLSLKERKLLFFTLLLLFFVSLPFLFLYATGYRFDLSKSTNIYSTGGLYIAVERTGTEIYIDDELVRETRAFRRAFYAQNITPGTHRVHVQKEGYHTWVKELPVAAHLVTVAESFNTPLVPNVRIIAPWQTATGTMVVRSFDLLASSTNAFVATTSNATSSLLQNTEFLAHIGYFSTNSPTTSTSRTPARTRQTGPEQPEDVLLATVPTTTREVGGARLYELDGEVYARWIGPFEQMPYYYCAEEFPRYSTSTSADAEPFSPQSTRNRAALADIDRTLGDEPLMHPVQVVPKDSTCDPVIKMDRRGQNITGFDFFPGSSDVAILNLEEGIYAIEIDDRAWQNAQPLLLGENLRFHIVNGEIYVYDGTLIYQIIIPSS